MNRKTDELTLLLNLDDLYILYKKIGDSINNEIDLNNSGYNLVAQNNSTQLLMKCGLITEEEGIFSKAMFFNEIHDFSSLLLEKIKIIYTDDIDEIMRIEKRYDEEKNLFCIPINSIDFNKSGLIMILIELGYLKKEAEYIYFLDERKLKNYLQKENKTSEKQITLIELKNTLVLKEKLGEIGERKALEYEKSLLRKQNIFKEPKLISNIDAGAGYDMVSYLSLDSQSYDKFIEIKNCRNMSQTFYFTSNEMDTAKEKGNSYFIYLYIRDDDKIIIIRNPYKNIIESSEWAKEPQLYKIHKLFHK